MSAAEEEGAPVLSAEKLAHLKIRKAALAGNKKLLDRLSTQIAGVRRCGLRRSPLADQYDYNTLNLGILRRFRM